jgi:hypothetical protein
MDEARLVASRPIRTGSAADAVWPTRYLAVPLQGSATGRFPPETSDIIGELIAPAPTPTTTSRRLLVVKRKYTKRHVKRSRHHDWSQPNRPPDQAVVV